MLLAEVAETERQAKEAGKPPLHVAASKGKQRVVELLLQRGASVDEVQPTVQLHCVLGWVLG